MACAGLQPVVHGMRLSRVFAAAVVSAAFLAPASGAAASTAGPSVSIVSPSSFSEVSGDWQINLTTTSNTVRAVGVTDDPNYCSPYLQVPVGQHQFSVTQQSDVYGD